MLEQRPLGSQGHVTLAAYRRDLVGVAARVAAARGVEPPEIRRHGVLIDP